MLVKWLFGDGIVNDITPELQPAGTARYVQNMRLITNGANYFSYESLKGTTVSFEITENYAPIGWTPLDNDYFVVLSTNDTTGVGKNGEIGIVLIDRVTKLGTYTPLYNHPDLDFSIDHQIECLTNPENQFIKRLYWTDFYNPPRSLNIADAILITNIPSGSLVVGQKYMCVKGEVEHQVASANFYGPQQTTTVFTATAATYTVIIPGSIVIDYIPVELLNLIPNKLLGHLRFKSWFLGGSLLCGRYQYSYRMVTAEGTLTAWSYLTNPVHLAVGIPTTSSVGYQNYQGGSATTVTTKGIKMTLDNIDTNYSRIQVAYVRSTAFNVYDDPIMFFDGDITGASMDFNHTGGDDLAQLIFDDLLLQLVNIKKTKTLAVHKNILFYGNIKTGDEIAFDPSTAVVKNIEYLLPSDVTGYPTNTTDSSTSGLSGHGMAPITGVPSGSILADGIYKVTVRNVIYNAVEYGPNAPATTDVFTGVVTALTYANGTGAGTPLVKAIIRIQKYTGTYLEVPLEDDWYDFKGMAAEHYLMSQWREEKYRWGVLAYDTIGNPAFVRWMDDKTVPHIYDTSATVDPDTGNAIGFDMSLAVRRTNGATHHVSVRSIGINVSGLNLQEITDALGLPLADLPKVISGFSMVRAVRDPQIYAQGLSFPTVFDGSGPPRTRPCAAFQLIDDGFYDAGAGNDDRKLNTYVLYSPDGQFRLDGRPSELAGDKWRIVEYLDDAIANASGGDAPAIGFRHAGVRDYYRKYYDPQAASGPANGTEEFVFTGIEAETAATGVLYDTAGTIFDNSGEIDGPGTMSPPVKRVKGVRTFVAFISGTETSTTGFGAMTSGATAKVLVNWKRPKAVLYGGDGDSAKANTLYQYAGHFQAIDAPFMAYLIGNGGVVDDIEVFGGDTFVSLYDSGRMLIDTTAANTCSEGLIFPVESLTNVNVREGRHLAKDRSQSAGNLNGIDYPNHVESFVYNPAYSAEDSEIDYSGLPVGFIFNNEFKARVIRSQRKTPGETADSFRIFLPNDFKDLDYRFLQINNLRNKDEFLFYWQDGCFGYLPVDERDAIPSTLGSPMTIGTGGVIERFDNIDSFYGNQNQWGLTDTENGFAWIDLKRRVLCYCQTGGKAVQISLVKNQHFLLAEILNNIQINNDTPAIRRKGIVSTYDHRFKEVRYIIRGVSLTFPFNEPQTKSEYPKFADIVVAFNITTQRITGFYIIPSGLYLNFDNSLYSSYEGVYNGINDDTIYSTRDKVSEGSDTYACILAYTSGSPSIIPSIDTTHWAKVNSKNEIFVHNTGDIGKFFGVVYDEEFVAIVNQQGDHMQPDNLAWNSSLEFFDDVYCSDSDLLGGDLDIPNNREFEYRNKEWLQSVPLSSDGQRFVDGWLRIKGIKRNANGSILISKNLTMKLLSLECTFRKPY